VSFGNFSRRESQFYECVCPERAMMTENLSKAGTGKLQGGEGKWECFRCRSVTLSWTFCVSHYPIHWYLIFRLNDSARMISRSSLFRPNFYTLQMPYGTYLKDVFLISKSQEVTSCWNSVHCISRISAGYQRSDQRSENQRYQPGISRISWVATPCQVLCSTLVLIFYYIMKINHN